MRLTLTVLIALLLPLVALPCALAQDDDNADLEKFESLMRDGDAADRIKASKWVRSHGGGEDFNERILPLLEENLQHSDPDVRKWTILALATKGDAALPLLEDALPNETDEVVLNQLNATIRHLKDAIAQREWIENHPCRKIDKKELLTWEVRELCDPIGSYPPIIMDLGDGTFIYGARHRANDECFRGKRKEPCLLRCMPPETLVSTPDGPVSINALEVDDPVWTVDSDGERVAAKVAQTRSLQVQDHQMIRITLVDGRVVTGSPSHPTANGASFAMVSQGDALDGSTVARVERLDYTGTQTYDILPSGESGLYFGNDVLIGSTLAPPQNAACESPSP